MDSALKLSILYIIEGVNILNHNKLTPYPFKPGCKGQSVSGLATDASLTADSGVPSLIPARSYTFAEIYHEIISTVILPPPPQKKNPLNHSRRVVISYKRKYVYEVLINCLLKLA